MTCCLLVLVGKCVAWVVIIVLVAFIVLLTVVYCVGSSVHCIFDSLHYTSGNSVSLSQSSPLYKQLLPLKCHNPIQTSFPHDTGNESLYPLHLTVQIQHRGLPF